MRRPSTAFPPTGAPRRHGARAEVDGESGRPGTRRRPPFHPPPGRGMERDGGSAHPGRAPRPRASHTPPRTPEKRLGPRRDGRVPGARARDPHARNTVTADPADRLRRTHTRLGQGRASADGGRPGRRRADGAAAEPRRSPEERKEARTEEPAVGRRAESDLGRPVDVGDHRRPPPPERAHARARARPASIREKNPARRGTHARRRRGRGRGAARGWCGKERRFLSVRQDKPLCRGLTLNRSQRGSCSATYETPTQKQVVYEWFSARFHTNVRST